MPTQIAYRAQRQIQATPKEHLLQKIMTRQATVAVIGQGYVGLPLATVYAEAGFTVIGIDIDADKVAALNNGTSYIDDVPAATVQRLVQAGKFSATTDFAALTAADVVLICVPTPLTEDKNPDMSYVAAACDQLQPYLAPGRLIVLESTTYPGGTEEVVLPRLLINGRSLGDDLFVAFSPERVDPGRVDYTIGNTPKVVGGVTTACREVAITFYSQAIKKLVPVSSARAAEMVKLLENTFRAVNIGMVNEMALMCDALGLDVWEIVAAAATKPYGFMPFTPGPGLGGHCIPIDPHYLAWHMRRLNFPARFIQLAHEVNESMPTHVMHKVADALNDAGLPLRGAKVLVLGVAYKRDVGDVRESPALPLMALLRQKGATVIYHDPFVPTLNEHGQTAVSVDLDAGLQQADCVVLVTDHTDFDTAKICNTAARIVDTRNALRHMAGTAVVTSI